jgi:hypothetical protein
MNTEIKENELIVTFTEDGNFVNTFVFLAEEDSSEFLTEVYHDFIKWCCGLDKSTRSILDTTDMWSKIKKTIDNQTSKTRNQYLNKCEASFSIKRNGIKFDGVVGYTNVLGYSPSTHVGTLSGDLNIKMYDQFLDDIVVSDRTFRMTVVYPHNLDHKLYDGKSGF